MCSAASGEGRDWGVRGHDKLGGYGVWEDMDDEITG